MQQPADETAGHAHLLVRKSGLCQDQNCDRNFEKWQAARQHWQNLSCHAAARTRTRRPMNQNIATEPIA